MSQGRLPFWMRAGRAARRRPALVVTILSLAFWLTIHLVRDAGNPIGDLSRGVYADHFTHMNTTRAFWLFAGLDIYRKPGNELARRTTNWEFERLPADIRKAAGSPAEMFQPEGWPENKPLLAAWSARPRCHPPGDLLLTAPAALTYHFTRLSFLGACKMLIASFIVYAHVAFYFLFRFAWTQWGKASIGAFATIIIYSEYIRWSLEGFYELAVMAPLVLCAWWIRDKRYLAATVAYCAATVIHFRAFFFAPWVIYAVVCLLRDRSWRSFRGRDWLAVLAAVLLSVCSLGVFKLLWPVLKTLEYKHNPVSLAAPHPNHASLLASGVVVSVVLVLFIRARAWLDIAILGWISLMLISLRETFAWDIMSMLAWLGAPASSRLLSRAPLARDGRLLFVLFSGAYIFGNNMMPSWVHQLTPTWMN